MNVFSIFQHRCKSMGGHLLQMETLKEREAVEKYITENIGCNDDSICLLSIRPIPYSQNCLTHFNLYRSCIFLKESTSISIQTYRLHEPFKKSLKSPPEQHLLCLMPSTVLYHAEVGECFLGGILLLVLPKPRQYISSLEPTGSGKIKKWLLANTRFN